MNLSDALLADWRDKALRLEAEVRRAVVGQDHAIRLINIAVFARGHVLLEGDVGVGKVRRGKDHCSGKGGPDMCKVGLARAFRPDKQELAARPVLPAFHRCQGQRVRGGREEMLPRHRLGVGQGKGQLADQAFASGLAVLRLRRGFGAAGSAAGLVASAGPPTLP